MKQKSRFDYIKYDDTSNHMQGICKEAAVEMEKLIETIPTNSSDVARAKALALTHLEHTYMWIGKAIKENQIVRNAVEFVDSELQEERTNS